MSGRRTAIRWSRNKKTAAPAPGAIGISGSAVRSRGPRLLPFISGLAVVGLVASISGCTPLISPQLMQQVERDLRYADLAAQPEAAKGKLVMLGGTIVQTTPRAHETEIEVVQKELSSSGEPKFTDKSEGRFLVVVDRFLDPAIYKPERDITVVGEARGIVVRRIGETDHRYPLIAGIEWHLWRPWPQRPTAPYPYPYAYPYPYRRWWHNPAYPYW